MRIHKGILVGMASFALSGLATLGAEDRAPTLGGQMAVEATSNWGYNLKNQQSGFSENFYLYLNVQLMDYKPIDVNKQADGPAGYIIMNGGGFNLVQNLDQSSSAGEVGKPDWTNTTGLNSTGFDVGWDNFAAGITMFPFYVEFLRHNLVADTYGSPDPYVDYAGLEGVMDRATVDGMYGRFGKLSDNAKTNFGLKLERDVANWKTSGGFELGYLGSTADLGLVVASRNDANYAPAAGKEGTVDDQRNNYVITANANLKHSFFGGLPLQFQTSVGAALFTERRDLSAGARLAYDADFPLISGGTAETFVAASALSSAYHKDNIAQPVDGSQSLTDWEASAGEILYLSTASGWKQDQARPAKSGATPWATSGGNHYLSYWRRWHDYGDRSGGYPGLSAVAQVTKMRETYTSGAQYLPTDAQVNVCLQAWEWDGKEGIDKNWGLASEVLFVDVLNQFSFPLAKWMATNYVSYRTDDEQVEPYGFVSWGNNRGGSISFNGTTYANAPLILALGTTFRVIDNAAFDLRWQTSDLSNGPTHDPGLINASVLVHL